MKKIILIFSILISFSIQSGAQTFAFPWGKIIKLFGREGGADPNAYYVSSTGSDSNDGLTPATAFATITKVNTLDLTGTRNKVLFKRGEIFSDATLTVSGSGTSEKNIIYDAYGSGAKPLITGFTTVTGWTNEGGGIYSKTLAVESNPEIVTINGVQYAMGRFPNAGTNLVYESAVSNTSITDTGLGDATDWQGAEAVIYKNPYRLDRCLITNHAGDVITYTNLGSTNNATAGSEYFIQNDIRTLDQFGEWYFDDDTDELFVFFDDENPTDYTVKVSAKDYLMTNTGGHDYITVKNLRFEGSSSSAIRFFTGTDYCLFDNVEIQWAGGDGMSLKGANATVTNSVIRNVNGGNDYAWNTGGGIFVVEENATITNNTISHVGAIEGQAYNSGWSCGVSMIDDNNTFRYNTISNTGYMGISLGASNQYTTVQYNFFDSTCLILPDAGAIYANYDKTGVLIDHNIVINSFGNGIYLDETASKATVSNNTVAWSDGSGIKGHKVDSDTIIENTLYANDYGLNYTNWTTTEYFQNMVVEDNIVVADSLQNVWYFVNRYTGGNDIGTATGNYYVMSAVDSLSFVTNVVGSSTTRYLSGWKTLTGTDAGSIANPYVYGNNDTIYYNATNTATSFTLADTLKDAAGTAYIGAVTLQPYTSLVLFDDFVLPGITDLDSMYAAYPLNGNANDTIASNDGTNSGAVAVAGKFGWAYDFDNDNDKISFAVNTDDFVNDKRHSVSLWFKIDAVASAAGVSYDLFWDVLNPTSWKTRIYINYASDVIQVSTRNTTNDIKSSTSSTSDAIDNTDTWYHVIVNIADVGDVAEIYINGQKSTGSTNQELTGTSKSSNGYMYLGDYYSVTHNSINGKIDEFKVRNKWYTAEEVEWEYNEGNGRAYPFE
jgi:hypothetical protein